jgi:hypothetical protein
MSPYAFGFEPLFLALAAAAVVLYWRAARRDPPSRLAPRIVRRGSSSSSPASLNSPLENLAAHYLLLIHCSRTRSSPTSRRSSCCSA